MDPYEMTRDEIRQELSELLIRLAEAPADDFRERLEMRLRQRELRSEIEQWPLSQEEVAAMQRSVAVLKHQRDELLKHRPNVAAMADSGEGCDVAIMQEFAAAYDENLGREELARAIARLERRIKNQLAAI